MDKVPYIWQMIKEAVESLGGQASYTQIKDYIKEKYGNVNENSLNAQIIVCTVNHPSRVHYPENSKPRVANSKYDFLFTTGRGKVELYDPEKHGIWEIRKDENGKLFIAPGDINGPINSEEEEEIEVTFKILENQLRDFIVQNITEVKFYEHTLKLYIDENGRIGVEYPTDVGRIDILALDEEDNFVVFELKISRGTDKVIGQLLRYMGWVKSNLSNGKDVKGVIVALNIDDKLRYAASVINDISLFEYELNFKIQEVSK